MYFLENKQIYYNYSVIGACLLKKCAHFIKVLYIIGVKCFRNDCKILISIVIFNNNKYIGKGDDANGYEEKN